MRAFFYLSGSTCLFGRTLFVSLLAPCLACSRLLRTRSLFFSLITFLALDRYWLGLVLHAALWLFDQEVDARCPFFAILFLGRAQMHKYVHIDRTHL